MKWLISLLLLPSIAMAAAAKSALCVDGWCLTQDAFNLLYEAAASRLPGLDQATYRQELVDVRLLANYARAQQFTPDATPHQVGFSAATEADKRLYSLLRRAKWQAFSEYSRKQLGKKGLNQYLLTPIHTHGLDIEAALKPVNRKAIAMTDEQLAAAVDIELVSYQFPRQPKQSLTLAQVYQRQNVQGRLALQNKQGRDHLIKKLVRDYLLEDYFYWWLQQQSDLDSKDLASVKQALSDRHLHNAWLQHQGLVEHLHTNASSRLVKRAAQVSQQQINDWYQQHKEDFKVTNSVHVMHLACVTKADCQAGHEALEQGRPVSDVVKQYADKSLQGDTDLGVMTRSEDGLKWITSLAMLQQPGSYSEPVHSPEGHWEVVWVTEKKQGYLAADSSSVRYRASRDIARAELLEEHHQLMEELHQQAQVTLP